MERWRFIWLWSNSCWVESEVIYERPDEYHDLCFAVNPRTSIIWWTLRRIFSPQSGMQQKTTYSDTWSWFSRRRRWPEWTHGASSGGSVSSFSSRHVFIHPIVLRENCHLNHQNLVEKMNFSLDHLKHQLSLNSHFKHQLDLTKPY